MADPVAKRPYFLKNESDSKQFLALRGEVYSLLKSLPASKHNIAKVKAFILPLVFFGVYLSALLSADYWYFVISYVFLGFIVVFIFLNIIHEASHNNLFQSKKWNRVFMLLLDILGANSYIWRKRHIHLHHNYTNVYGWDSDIEKSKLLKVHAGEINKPVHKYQHLMFFLYPLFVVNWFLFRDFKDFFNKNMIVRKIVDIPLKEYFLLFGFKLIFVSYIIILPSLLTPFSLLQVLIAFLLMLLSAGVLGLISLLPPHVNATNAFPIVNEDMSLDNSWLLHQLITTNDVSSTNWFTRYMMGNFNFHIAHHLFPNISYVYAEDVTALIKKYCLDSGLPYRAYPLLYTFKAHHQMMRNNRAVVNIFEEDM